MAKICFNLDSSLLPHDTEAEQNKVNHDMTKPTKWHVRPSKTQICLGIHPVWSEFSLSTWRKLGSLTTYWAHWADAQADLRLRWAHSHFVGFVMSRLKFVCHWTTIYQTILKQTDSSVVLPVFSWHHKLSWVCLFMRLVKYLIIFWWSEHTNGINILGCTIFPKVFNASRL